jgi:YggT family protein
MQNNPNPNDPNYMPSLQENPQGVPPYQPAQPVYQNQPGVPPYQGQPGVPPYQGQPGVPPYQGQPGVPYTTQPNQYTQNPAQQKKQARKYGVAKAMDYLQWVLFALEMLFLLRFVLKLLGADPNNPFAQALYNFTGFFLYPFSGIVPTTTIGPNGNGVIEWSTLIGMAVYAVLFYLIKLLLRITISRPQEPI